MPNKKGTFGERIRELREKANMPLRKLSALLDIDQSTLSKIERDERSIKEEQIPLLAEIFNVDNNELTILWLTDQVYNIVKDNPLAIPVLNEVMNKINKGI